jgi:hypothetical protein
MPNDCSGTFFVEKTNSVLLKPVAYENINWGKDAESA